MNGRFTAAWSRCRLNLKFENFARLLSSFARLRQRIVLKCTSHVQLDYFSSFNQSDVVVAVANLVPRSSKLAFAWENSWVQCCPKKHYNSREIGTVLVAKKSFKHRVRRACSLTRSYISSQLLNLPPTVFLSPHPIATSLRQIQLWKTSFL